jgi:hypothetical protein
VITNELDMFSVSLCAPPWGKILRLGRRESSSNTGCLTVDVELVRLDMNRLGILMAFEKTIAADDLEEVIMHGVE